MKYNHVRNSYQLERQEQPQDQPWQVIAVIIFAVILFVTFTVIAGEFAGWGW
jgi:hypothetical protein